jgi:NADPH-ferrihemoprotein reductase
VATYGEGEPTDNTAKFYKEYANYTKDNFNLSNLSYCVFGLGNKTYEHFNAFARNLDNKLSELGAKRVGPRGEGDDDANLEADFNAWKMAIWGPICGFYGKKQSRRSSLSE